MAQPPDVAAARRTLLEQREQMHRLLAEMHSCSDPKQRRAYVKVVDGCLERLRAARRVLEGYGEGKET